MPLDEYTKFIHFPADRHFFQFLAIMNKVDIGNMLEYLVGPLWVARKVGIWNLWTKAACQVWKISKGALWFSAELHMAEIMKIPGSYTKLSNLSILDECSFAVETVNASSYMMAQKQEKYNRQHLLNIYCVPSPVQALYCIILLTSYKIGTIGISFFLKMSRHRKDILNTKHKGNVRSYSSMIIDSSVEIQNGWKLAGWVKTETGHLWSCVPK